jgi:4-hydroxy-tetrahydrodipicolinate synthase
MLYNNPFTANVDMPTRLVANLTRSFEQIRYIKEASMDAARVFDIIEATDGVMNVFAGERIVESYLMGAVGYVNPYGNYIPRASSRICDMLAEGQVNEAKRIQHVIDEMQEVIGEGHPTYGHQCYSKALAASAGYPVGDVRPPLTTFKELGEEGTQRRDKLCAIMKKLDILVDELDGKLAA